MAKHLFISIKLVIISIILLGIVYPLTITGISRIFFPRQADGSLIRQNGIVIGSALIGQKFTRKEYFHPRPSMAGDGYNATASSGSNLGPTSGELAKRVSGEISILLNENPNLKKSDIPIDMVTASGSGLDPDITPANAYAQSQRIAVVRGIPETEIRTLIRTNITNRQFGILGEPRVNVLKINMMLDKLYGKKHD